MTGGDRDAALECRIAAATPDELRVLRDFFTAPRLRAHFTGLIERIERELRARDKAAALRRHRRRLPWDALLRCPECGCEPIEAPGPSPDSDPDFFDQHTSNCSRGTKR